MQGDVAIAALHGVDAAVFIDTQRHVAFGPVFQGSKYRTGVDIAIAFHQHLSRRFPYVNISTINTERLLIYYKEFLAHESATVST